MSQTDNDRGAAVFEDFVALLNYPLFVVTTQSGDHRAGCLIGFASQVSIDPSRFFAGLSKANHTYRTAAAATHLAVHVIPREHAEVARLFGGETGDDIDKFARCRWHEGPHGLPILDDAAAWFTGRILRQIDAGDHVGFLLEPSDGAAAQTEQALVTLADVQDLDPGHDA